MTHAPTPMSRVAAIEIGAASPSEPIRLMDVLNILNRYKLLVGLTPVVVALAMLLFTTFWVQPTFTARTVLLAPQQTPSTAAALLGSMGGLAAVTGGSLAGLRGAGDQWVGLLSSETIADTLIRQFDLKNLYGSRFQFQARRALAGRTRIAAGKDGLIRIEVDDHDPQRAAKLANAYVDQLRELTKALALTEAAQRRLYFENLMREAKDNLVKAEVALRVSGVSESILKTRPETVAVTMAQIRNQISALEVRIASLRSYATDASPELRGANAELESLRRQLATTEQAAPGQANARGAEYITRYRDFKYHETLFELMAKQYEMARADEARQGAVIQVIDLAQPPEYKSGPKRASLILMAAFASFVLCSAAVIVLELLRGSSRALRTT